MLAICSLCKNYIVKAIEEQQTMTASALPEIILTTAEVDKPDVSFHTNHDFSDRGDSGGSLRLRPNLTSDSNNAGLDNVYDTDYGKGLERGVVLSCISFMYCCDECGLRSFVCE